MSDMKTVQFEFPDPDGDKKPEIEIEPALNRTENVMETLKEQKEEKAEEPKKEDGVRTIKEGDVEIEVLDDTPEGDRGKEPFKDGEEPPDVTDDELSQYGKKVKKRLSQMSKKLADQRRAAETVQRERDEMASYMQGLLNENSQLKQNSGRSRNSLIQQAKKAAAAEVTAAQKDYEEAFNSGDTKKIVASQTKLSEAVAKKSKVDSWKPTPLQKGKPPVKQQNTQQLPQQAQPRQQPQQAPPEPPPRLKEWMDENSWFGSDVEMTAFAQGVNMTLQQGGVDGTHPEYYKKLDGRMREKFPEEFEIDAPEQGFKSQQPDSVVAPVSRSSAPKKMKLTETQVALAKRMGIPLEKYAHEAAKIEMKRG